MIHGINRVSRLDKLHCIHYIRTCTYTGLQRVQCCAAWEGAGVGIRQSEGCCAAWEGAGVGIRQSEGSHGRKGGEGHPGGYWLVCGAPLDGGGVSRVGECEPVDVVASMRRRKEL